MSLIARSFADTDTSEDLVESFKVFDIYGNGFKNLLEYSKSHKVHSETYLSYTLKKHNINVRTAKEAVEHALKNWDENNIDENSSIHKSFWE